MEVILIKDLKRKGTFGDVIEVADGYATNYLIPNGFALSANKSNRKRFEEMKDKALVEVTKLRDDLKSTAAELKGKSFTMTALSRDGKLYGSITPSVIVDTIKSDLPDVKVNASDIIIEEGNIKYVGTYACKAQFTKDISADFEIVIESDESHEQPELLEAILDEDDAIAEEITEEAAEIDADAAEDDDSVESEEIVAEVTEADADVTDEVSEESE